MGLLDELTREELEEMKIHLGLFLLNLPVAAKLMRHKSPLAGTIRGHYLCAAKTRAEAMASEYLTDMVEHDDADWLIEKWGVPPWYRDTKLGPKWK